MKWPLRIFLKYLYISGYISFYRRNEKLVIEWEVPSYSYSRVGPIHSRCIKFILHTTLSLQQVVILYVCWKNLNFHIPHALDMQNFILEFIALLQWPRKYLKTVLCGIVELPRGEGGWMRGWGFNYGIHINDIGLWDDSGWFVEK